MQTRGQDNVRGRGGDSSKRRINSFRDLNVWNKSMDTAMDVFALTRHFPPTERYSLTDQIRRSSRSVPANISEGWRKRRYPLSFISKLNDAEGEAAETQTHIEIAFRCDYIDQSTFSKIDQAYEEILAMLTKMVTNADDWTIPQATAHKSVSPSRPRALSPSSQK